MRGRKPKPTALRLLNGNPGKRRLRREPSSVPLAGPPDTLPEDLAEIWAEIAQAAPPSVLRRADALMVELLCRLLAQVRFHGDERAGTAAQVRACMSELGMTPSARARLAVAMPPAGNPFAGLEP